MNSLKKFPGPFRPEWAYARAALLLLGFIMMGFFFARTILRNALRASGRVGAIGNVLIRRKNTIKKKITQPRLRHRTRSAPNEIPTSLHQHRIKYNEILFILYRYVRTYHKNTVVLGTRLENHLFPLRELSFPLHRYLIFTRNRTRRLLQCSALLQLYMYAYVQSTNSIAARRWRHNDNITTNVTTDDSAITRLENTLVLHGGTRQTPRR